MASPEAEFAEGALAAEQEELQALQDELIALEGIAQPTQAQLDRIAALPGLISTQQDVVTDAVDDAANAQEALALAGTLEDALDEMSNKPIDADVVTWAEGVLGVGENVGKIDEMREMLEAAVAEEAAAETPAQTSSTSSAARPALATATSAAVAPSASGPSDIGLPQSLKPRSTLPCEGDGCPPSRDGGDAVALQPPWRSIRAIPNPVVRVCALAIGTAARSYGAVGVDASSSGPLRRQGRGRSRPPPGANKVFKARRHRDPTGTSHLSPRCGRGSCRHNIGSELWMPKSAAPAKAGTFQTLADFVGNDQSAEASPISP